MGERKKSVIILSFLITVTFSCSKDRFPNQQSAFEYFPLVLGKAKEYDVERTTYSLSSLPEKQRFITRQLVIDTFKMPDNQVAYKIEHFAQNNRAEWKLDSVSAAWQTSDKTTTRENGQTVINMIYPLSNGLEWNGNSFNNNGASFWRVTNLGKSFQTKFSIFQNTVTIIRQDDSTFLSRNTYIEVYALNVGLIRREKSFLKYCGDPDCLGKGIINYGWKELSSIRNY